MVRGAGVPSSEDGGVQGTSLLPSPVVVLLKVICALPAEGRRHRGSERHPCGVHLPAPRIKARLLHPTQRPFCLQGQEQNPGCDRLISSGSGCSDLVLQSSVMPLDSKFGHAGPLTRTPRKTLRVFMTVLGRKGGMDRIADLITERIEAQPDLGIQLTRLTTRGRGSIFWGSFIFAFALVRFWIAAFRGQVDVLHLNVAAQGSAYRKLLLARVAQRLKIPYVVHLHGSRFREFWSSLGPRARHPVDRLFLESAKIAVLGQFWAQFVIEMLPGIEGKIVILPNATMPISEQPSRPRGALVRISCIGELGARKGTPQLIEALGLLAERGDWRATIAGNGDVNGSRARARSLGLAHLIDIPGWIDAAGVNELLHQTDILVLASFAENLPMAILEGFAHGIAVVATPVGAIPEVIDHERNGLIVPVGDVNALADSLRRLIESPELRLRLGEAARRDHADRYDINIFVTRLAAIWREAAQSSAT